MIIGRPTAKPVLRLGDPNDTPATMRVTSPFGDRAGGFHGAIDIGNYVAGDTLVACADAVVIAVGYLAGEWSSPKPSDAWWNAQELNAATGQRGGLYGPPSRWVGPVWGGLQIILDLGDGWVAGYAHCATVNVARGQRISRGAPIGTVGDTGSAYRQPHLHFGLRFGGEWVDPWPLINGAEHPHLEDDMQLPTTASYFVQGEVNAGVNLRKSPETRDNALLTKATTPLTILGIARDLHPYEIVVDGKTVKDDDWYLVMLANGEVRWAAKLLVHAIRPTAFLFSQVPLPATGIDPAVAATRIYEAADATARAARRHADGYRPS